MKKTLFLALLCTASYFSVSYAQGLSSFFGGIIVDFSIGPTYGHYDKVYDHQKFGFGIGLDVSKPITKLSASRADLYGLVGVRVLQKSGGIEIEDVGDEDSKGENLVANRLSVPIYIGYRYRFSKCSLFVHAGPYFSFHAGGDENNGDDIQFSSTEFGVGLDFGIKFKRFSLLYGLDQGLTKLASCEKESSLKAITPHFMLVWSL